MKKIYLIALLALVFQFANAQLDPVAYRGAFAPAPAAMWTDSWTNWNPQSEAYTDAATVVTVSANITSNTVWTTGKTYKLTGTIYVTNNATLTIQPGVVVKGQYSNTGTALIITKGAKINAVGTAASPIVFTSDKAAGTRAAGDWGGIILLGKDKFNQTNGLNNIEGLAANALTEYGGGATPDVNDNSGTLKYVRIEYGGFVFSPNNEINGLTMGAVGAGTTIDYVQVSFSGDDAFEWFGGSVNCKHLIAYRALDDDFDTDNGYAGTVQFGLAVRDPQLADNPAISTSEGFESDNNPGDIEPIASPNNVNTSAIFSNITSIGPVKRLATGTSLASGYARALRLRRRTELKVINSIFMDWKNNYAGLTDATTVAKAIKGELKLNNNIFAGSSTSDFTSYPEGVNPRTYLVTSAMNVIAPTAVVGSTFNLGTWMTTNNNTALASSTGVLTTPYNTTLDDYSGLDYRPGTTASTGADFTDAKIVPFVTIAVLGTQPVVANVNLCQGAIATPLTATKTSTGVSLKWYTATTETGVQTELFGDIVPTTTNLGTQYFWVSQLDADGNESNKSALTVTVNAIPTATFAGIYNTTNGANTTNVDTFAVAQYVGTTTAFTFSVPALTDSSLSYVWSFPNGVNKVSGGTATDNTITVNFNGVSPDFVGIVGTISVKAKNASTCFGTVKEIEITTALPAAPAAITVTEGSATTAVTNFNKYAGTTTALTLTATASASATSYVWSLPAGVNVVTSGTPVTTTKVFYSYPFSGSGGVGNTSAGARKYTVTYNKYTVLVNGVSTDITISTAKQELLGGSGIAAGITQNPFVPYGTVITSDKNAISVNFSGVTVAASTNALYIGVKAKNAAGDSATNNATNADVIANSTSIPGLFVKTYADTGYNPAVLSTLTPATSAWTVTGTVASTATLVKLTAVAPAAVASIVLTNPAVSTTAAITDITVYGGTSTVLTLTAAASDLATSYEWVLPSGVTAVTGSNLTSNSIQVNLASIPAGTTSLIIGVKAINVYGTSTTKLLNLTAAAPAAPAALVLTNSAVSTTAAITDITVYGGTSSTLTLTAAASDLATSYEWLLPAGVTAVSTDLTSNTIQVNFSSILAGTTSLNIGVKAKNFVGSSSTKLLSLTATVPAAPDALILTNPAAEASATPITDIALYKGTNTALTLTAAASDLATSYEWELPTGVTALSTNLTGRIIEVKFAAITSASIYIGVKAKNFVGSSLSDNSSLDPVTTSTAKLLKLFTTAPVAAAVKPATLKLTDVAVSSTLAITNVSTYAGTNRVLTLTAASSANAASYIWTLPSGVTQLTGTTSNVITVKLADVASTVTSLTFSVKATNSLGSSLATTLMVSISAPAVPAAIKMTNNALTGTAATTAITNASIYVGTETPLTLTATASPYATSYSWTLPNGVTKLSGDNTNVITVKLAGVPAGVTSLSFNVKAVNNLSSSADKTLAITTAVPSVPAAIKLTDASLTGTAATTAITAPSIYVGTDTPLTLTATVATNATSYSWTLPDGVTKLSGDNSNVITVKLANVQAGVTSLSFKVKAVNGVGSSAEKVLATTVAAPAAPTTLVLSTTTTTTAITNVTNYVGTSTNLKLTAAVTKNATSYSWTLPNGVTKISGDNTNVIIVKLDGVLPGVTSLSFKVKAVNGAGSSIDKVLTTPAAAPAAPATLVLTNPALSNTAITDISVYGRTNTTLTLTAAVTANATSYLWELPTGVNRVDANTSNVSTSNVITVNFADVPSGTMSLNIGVKAVNYVGSSSTVNAGLASTAKLLKLTAARPTVVSAVSGQVALVCPNSFVTYTITAPKGATSYSVTGPIGSDVFSPSSPNNTTNSLETSDLTFTVRYPSNFAAVAVKKITIASINFVGSCLTTKYLYLTAGTSCTGKIDEDKVANNFNIAAIYPNPTSEIFNVNFDSEVPSILSMQIYSINGILISERSISVEAGRNNITENVSSYSNGIYFVRFTNSSNEVIVKKIIKN
jgi:limonene-1,2-epoxide hydrolase